MAGSKFNDKQFDDLVRDYGYLLLVEKHATCPCVSSDKPDADPDCPICHGLHFVWKPYGIIQALAYSIKESKSQVDFTKVSMGDKTITTRYCDKLALNDRVRFVHTPEIQSETLEATLDDEGIRCFSPYYDVISFESALAEDGSTIDLSRVSYNITKDKIYVKDYSGDRISIRYKYYPYFLISDLMHSNRQQWTGVAGTGRLMQLPNQYLAKRITTKLEQTTYPSLIEKDLLADYLEDIKKIGISANSEMLFDTKISFSVYAETLKKDINFYRQFQADDFTFELFLVCNDNLELLRLEETVKHTLDIQGVISSTSELKGENIQQGDIFLFLFDKYKDERVFCAGDDNNLLRYKGGDYLERGSWEEVLPRDSMLVTSKVDYRGLSKLKYVFDAESFSWHEFRSPVVINYADGKVTLQQADVLLEEFNVSMKLGKRNYFCLLGNNKSLWSNFQFYINGELLQVSAKPWAPSLLFKRTVTFLGSGGSLLQARIFGRKLDVYEMQSDMKLLGQ